MQADIAGGKPARGKKAQGRGGRSTGGPGVAGRTISSLRALLGHAARLGLIEKNPALGVRQIAVRKMKRRLSAEELRHLGKVMRQAQAAGEHPTGLGAIRVMLLTGFRRMEALGLQRAWFKRQDHAIHFPDTKSGEQIRVIGEAAISRANPYARVRPIYFRLILAMGTSVASCGCWIVFVKRQS